MPSGQRKALPAIGGAGHLLGVPTWSCHLSLLSLWVLLFKQKVVRGQRDVRRGAVFAA